MKIAIVVRILWSGGVQRLAFAEADGLRRLGNSVDLIFIRSTNKYTYDFDISYRVLYGEEVNDRFLGKIFRVITSHYLPQRGEDATVDIDLIYYMQHNLKENYDIVYYFDELSALFQKSIKKKLRCKTVVSIFEVSSIQKMSVIKFIQKKAIKNADLILTITKENLDLLKKYSIKNVEEVYPGLEIHENVPTFEERENIVLSVTMWDYGRKPEVLLEIAKNLKSGKLIIAGSWTDDVYFQNFRNVVRHKNLESKVTITGPLGEEQLIELYKKSKLSIRFGYGEKGPGMGSLESISWGIPLIINDGIGIKEIVREGINGYIVDEQKSKMIAGLADDLFVNKEKWNSLSKNNLILSNEFSWEAHCKKLDSIFKELIQKN